MRLKQTKQRRLTIGSRGSWVAGLLLSLIAYTLAQTPLPDVLERRYYEVLLGQIAPVERSGKVVIVDSGDAPSHDELAKAVSKLRKAKAIAMMLPLAQREHDAVLQQLAQLKEEQPTRGDTLDELAMELDGTARLRTAIKRSGNVWLASYLALRKPVLLTAPTRLRSLAQPSLLQIEHQIQPLEALREVARGTGAMLSGEPSSVVPAAYQGEGTVVPTLFYQLLPTNLQQQAGDAMAYRYQPKVDISNRKGVATYSLAELLAEEVTPNTFTGKTIMVGDRVRVGGHAVALDALLQGQQIRAPQWVAGAQYGALLAVTLFLMLLLPRLGLTSGLLSMLLVLFLLVNAEVLFLLIFSQWLPLLMPTLLLLGGYIVVTLQRRVSLHRGDLVQELSLSNMQLGRMLQSQGELEQAWEKYRRCADSEALREQLYNLGLDFERKRQYNKAVALFEELQRLARNFRDVSERLKRNREMNDRIMLPQANVAPGGTVVMEATQGLQRPTLGHYHIEKEIGRGAMGMVYLGQDPRINREVAIKTMALAHEFEGQELKEVKRRFFREAETAGRLNHPNIVTIYDVGEEQELAYIAMDYLKGENLAAFTSKKTLLPLKEVMAIIEQVAEALDYAHKQSVVHRDIKPANIIYQRSEKVVKVTDFGVACLTDASKTKTGTVLGSPSYMSPEQVAGKRVDGRADIFSLGVTLYQLTTGHLPFEADSLGSLMFMITNQPHPKPGKFRKGLPVCLTRIINKCLQKELTRRYQNAGEVASALKRCRGG